MEIKYRLWSFLLFMVIAVPCGGAEPPKAPILRIEAGMHTALIRAIATDAANRLLITGSDDKTVRVWERSSGRLLQVMRPPIGPGDEGKLYSVAVSPDGEVIACGGWTQFNDGSAADSPDGHTIYLFNRATGGLINRLTGVPAQVYDLSFSPDGRYLAASGKQELRIYTVSGTPRMVAEDREPDDKGYSVRFSPDGRRLVTTNWDGKLRLYDLSGLGSGERPLLLHSVSTVAPGGSRPVCARFSPDGSKIAVGYDGSTSVTVHSALDLGLLYSPDTGDLRNNNANDLASVAWSADGLSLFAAGTCRNRSGETFIRRWAQGGRGRATDIPSGATNRIYSLVPLQNGDVAFGAADPAFGVIDQEGKKPLAKQAPIADFRQGHDAFLVDASGSSILFGYEYGGRSRARLGVKDRMLLPESEASRAEDDLKASRLSTELLSITNWKDSKAPRVNGRLLKLEPNEVACSLAVAPEGNAFLLGTEWYLRLFDGQGREIWHIPATGAVSVNISGNGKVALAALRNGTIRWYRMKDGKELLALFPSVDRRRWVMWTPSGYYDSSPGGEDLVGWHVNNGMDKEADFFPSSRFREVRYRPDVVAGILQTLDEGEAVRLADGDLGRRTKDAGIAGSLPPVVRITAPDDGTVISRPSLTIRYTVRSPEDARVTGVRIMLDGRPYASFPAAPANDKEQTIVITLPGNDCEVSIIAENVHAPSVPASVHLVWREKRAPRKPMPRLFVLAVGVGNYKDRSVNPLLCAAKDAEDFARAMELQKDLVYSEVTATVLIDASKEVIEDGLQWLEKNVSGADVGMIFLSGHGLNVGDRYYYFITSQTDLSRLKATGLGFSDIQNTLSALKGKAVIFLDTCHSGNIAGTNTRWDMTKIVNELGSPEHGIVVFAASDADHVSYEDREKWGNGAFTKALVDGIRGEADLFGTGKITISNLHAYISNAVQRLTDEKQKPAYGAPGAIPDFTIAVTK